MNVNELERLSQIRDRARETPHYFTADFHFLLSLLDSQASPKPVGWISCGLRQGHDDRIVDIVFENADCAKAFIDGVQPAVGPIVAATQMRDQCVEKLGQVRDNHFVSNNEHYEKGFNAALKCAEVAMRSLTLDVEQKEAK